MRSATSMAIAIAVTWIVMASNGTNLTQGTEPSRPQVQFSAADVSGNVQQVPDARFKASVVVFSRTDCPIANAYQPAIQALAKEFSQQGVAFLMVHVDPQVTAESAQQHAREYGIEVPVIIDPEYIMARACDARVTPEVFLIDANGLVCYRGRIDDRFPELGKKRPRPSREDLKLALNEFLSGTTVSQPVTQAVGCAIRK